MKKRILAVITALVMCLSLAGHALAEEGFTDEELCDMARLYYEKNYLQSPQYVVVDGETDGYVTIHLFNVIGNMSATCDWYSIDRKTAKGTDFMGNTVDLSVYAGAYQSGDAGFNISGGVLIKYNGTDSNIVIPGGVTEIADDAFFACNTMTSVVIPDSVTTIGSCSFFACGNLTSVVIPDSVTKIGLEAFWSCGSLKEVTIGSGIREMGGGAFRFCDSLEKVTIRDGAAVLGTNAFGGCEQLASIVVPSSVTQIGDGTFEIWDGAIYCGMLPNVTIYGVSGSYAETYAKQKGIPFKATSGNSTSAAPSSPAKTAATPTASNVLVNGEKKSFDAYNIGGSNYFKLRDLAYVLSGTEKQFEVGWDNAARAISLTSGTAYTAVGGEMTGKGSGTQTANPSSARIILNGKEISLTAYEIGGNNYFKLRDIGETFDFGVGWDNASKTITIDTSTGYTAE